MTCGIICDLMLLLNSKLYCGELYLINNTVTIELTCNNIIIKMILDNHCYPYINTYDQVIVRTATRST